MRRLGDFQSVVLDLEEEAIDCVVEAVTDEEATIRPVSAADASYIPTLGRAAALVFEAGEHRVRLPGVVRRAHPAGRLRFVAGDGTNVAPRRHVARVGAELEIALTPLAAGGEPAGAPQRLRTCDVGLGGLGVRVGGWSPPAGAELRFELDLPAAGAVRGTARVLRVADGVAGLELAEVPAGDRARLAAFLISSRAGS